MDVSDPNISLVERILNTQKRVYIKGGTDVFISIPFCPTKCEYCSFITAPIGSTKGYVEDYLNCLVKEIESVAGKIHNLKSVYIGGGTPFVLEVDQLERVYSALSKAFPKIREYTVEAGRADVFTEEKLAQAKRWGVTRICVNPQSFNNKTLEAIGRKHTAEQTIEAYHMAEKYGFDINIDLIAGLADEGVEEFAYSVDKAIELNPANITVHTLSLKSGAKLKENVKRLNIDCIEDMVMLSRRKLSDAGYEPYYMYRQKYQAGGLENVGWAKRGKACVYNVDVMEEIADNLALGANAISKKLFDDGSRIERHATPKDLVTYISKVDTLIKERGELFGYFSGTRIGIYTKNHTKG
jgi:oxygen-independent coproporphyrinogen-3 oxidase